MRVKEALKGPMGRDLAHSSPESRSHVVRKWHSCPLHWQEMTGLDRTAHSGMCLSLSCLVPLSPWENICYLHSENLSKHLGPSGCLAFKQISVPFCSFSVWCVNIYSHRFDRLTRIHSKKNKPKLFTHVTCITEHRHTTPPCCIQSCNKKQNLKDYWDNREISHVQTHYLNTRH